VTSPAVLLDTNLLVLYVVGLAAPDHIASHRLLAAYGERANRAFALLVECLSDASTLLVTPNILTETSNLLGGRDRDDEISLTILGVFRNLIDIAVERTVPSHVAAARPEFFRLGLADAATIALLDDDDFLLTDDAGLYDATLRAGQRAELFSHYLAAAGLSPGASPRGG
jgi:hypothetical protein